MKKLVALLLALMMLLSFVACGDNADSTETTPDNETQEQTKATAETNDQTVTVESQPAITEEVVTASKFEQFENALAEKNIQFERNQKSAEMVGAKEGYGYLFSDGTAVELYLFDTSTDAYKEASSNNKLTLAVFNMTLDVIFNDDVCIYFNGELANQSEIQAIFESLK